MTEQLLGRNNGTASDSHSRNDLSSETSHGGIGDYDRTASGAKSRKNQRQTGTEGRVRGRGWWCGGEMTEEPKTVTDDMGG